MMSVCGRFLCASCRCELQPVAAGLGVGGCGDSLMFGRVVRCVILAVVRPAKIPTSALVVLVGRPMIF
jgi:hypothetical protein